MNKPSLKTALENGQFVLAPGIHDMITAVVSNKIGFDFVYASGYWMGASALGLPDAGIASYTQMLDRVATLCRVSNSRRHCRCRHRLWRLVERASYRTWLRGSRGCGSPDRRSGISEKMRSHAIQARRAGN
ncbi:hypothetical protein OEG86_01250 [Hoeflea alexandrii]|uniref:hypothetical protein n=1 Tax=Hoeflea alexandrii TaxID=288436 RepID=UPI00226EB95E|nr:hypothetical protein [Hoeflea alexandrii]MCY0151121.1 hypothetical protein [Hoeflea alexandrii]